ncbi:MAG: ORF6N domain-containing protein, partial [Saprospiraceae bacterium]
LNKAVQRNRDRFPEDFMFELSKQEFEDLRSQIVTSNRGGVRYSPMAFTEHGVLMISSVLKSRIAIELNIHIVRIFSKMRQMLASQKEIISKLNQMESKLSNHDVQLSKLFEAIKELILEKMTHTQTRERKQIGFRK